MRTRAYWNALIDTALAALGLSSSAVADWKLLRDIFVTVAMALDGIWQLFKADIDLALATKQAGTVGWYAVVAKAYQAGESLIVTNGVVGYATINPAVQIITNAAVRELDEEVIVVKAAKTAGGVRAVLNPLEMIGFKNYMVARRFPGVKLNVISTPPDVVAYVLEVFFNPQFDSVLLAAAIDTALAAFADNFSFDAVLYREQLLKTVMNVPGVINVTGSFSVVYGSGGGESLIDFLELPAGYFNYDGGSLLTLTPVL